MLLEAAEDGSKMSSSFGFDAAFDLELQLKEKLHCSGDFVYEVSQIQPPECSEKDDASESSSRFSVCLAQPEDFPYFPRFVEEESSENAAKMNLLKKFNIYFDLVQSMSTFAHDNSNRLTTSFLQIVADYKQLLYSPFAASLATNIPSDRFAKQKAKFRIFKSEDADGLVKSPQSTTKTTAASIKSCILDVLSNEQEAADVRLISLCEKLALPFPTFSYEEKIISNFEGESNIEVSCTVEFFKESFHLSKIGAKRSEIRESVAELALERFRDKLQDLEYEQSTLEYLESLKGPAPLKKPVKLFSSSSEAKIVPIDLDLLNNPLTEHQIGDYAHGELIASNIVAKVNMIAFRMRLKVPVYEIKSLGLSYTGKASFGGHDFDLSSQQFSSKREVKAQLAHMIWKSLESVSHKLTRNPFKLPSDKITPVEHDVPEAEKPVMAKNYTLAPAGSSNLNGSSLNRNSGVFINSITSHSNRRNWQSSSVHHRDTDRYFPPAGSIPYGVLSGYPSMLPQMPFNHGNFYPHNFSTYPSAVTQHFTNKHDSIRTTNYSTQKVIQGQNLASIGGAKKKLKVTIKTQEVQKNCYRQTNLLPIKPNHTPCLQTTAVLERPRQDENIRQKIKPNLPKK